MSYNGSGTFVINTAGQPVVSGTVISSTAFNALTADLATGLSTAITKDGQTTPTANIPMGNNKITGLAVGTAATDAANLSQVQSTVSKLINSISGADTITGTMSPTLGAYATGQMFYFVAAGTNTGAVTLNIDSLGAKAVTRDGSTALTAGDLRSGEVIVVVYDGTRFQVVSQVNSGGDATFANVSITSALNVGGVATVTGGATLNGGVVINEPGADVDFRVEGDTDANLIFADASTDRLGIGTSSPGVPFEVKKDGVVATGNWYNIAKIYDSSGNKGLQLGYDNTSQTTILAASTSSAASKMAFYTYSGSAWSQAMTLDASGNLGVGATSPNSSYRLTIQGVGTSANPLGGIVFRQGSTDVMYLGNITADNTTDFEIWNPRAGYIRFGTSNSERVRISDAGYLLVNSTDQASTGARVVSKDSGYCYGATTTTANTSDVYYFNFVSSAAGQNGYIWRSTSTGVTQLTSGSDARLKKDIVDASFNGLSVVSNVKVREFTWKDSGNRSVGFIAQELYEACPDAVAVGKDDAEGNIERPWGVSREGLVPYLVKAIQELKAELDATKAEVAALKGA